MTPDSRPADGESSDVNSHSLMASAAPLRGAPHAVLSVDHLLDLPQIVSCRSPDDKLMTNDLARADTSGYMLAFVPNRSAVDYH